MWRYPSMVVAMLAGPREYPELSDTAGEAAHRRHCMRSFSDAMVRLTAQGCEVWKSVEGTRVATPLTVRVCRSMTPHLVNGRAGPTQKTPARHIPVVEDPGWNGGMKEILRISAVGTALLASVALAGCSPSETSEQETFTAAQGAETPAWAISDNVLNLSAARAEEPSWAAARPATSSRCPRALR